MNNYTKLHLLNCLVFILAVLILIEFFPGHAEQIRNIAVVAVGVSTIITISNI